ncbi:hypothetical protein HGRIS_001935 [Hohenbuehelia grisea]|uniref:Sm domain-containing protein n=1 Tax=Hohenbuehelia grisea TaxID=104357 RepID=A0ABR3JIX4_9AGAR
MNSPFDNSISRRKCLDDTEWQTLVRDDPNSPFAYHSRASFFLPVNTDVMTFSAVGHRQKGVFNICASDEFSDKAKVDIVVSYHSVAARASACLYSLHQGGQDVGYTLSTPEDLSGSHLDSRNPLALFFSVTVHLPAKANGLPLLINSLSTNLPLFAHRVSSDLKDRVSFKQISLRSSNSPIDVKFLEAEIATIHTSNAPISGFFDCSYSLMLLSSNHPINIDARLSSDDNGATQLIMGTSNSGITASISLLKKNGSMRSGGTYIVNGKTTNGRLDFKFPESPINATLHLDGKTTNGSGVMTTLNPAYEGSISLKTSNARAELVECPGVVGPYGKKRRVTKSSTTMGQFQGYRFQAQRSATGATVVLLQLTTTPPLRFNRRAAFIMLPLSLLNAAQNKPMLVELKNGETFNGHLVNCDNFMNITLREVYQTNSEGDRFWKLKECYIRGSTIKYLRVPDTLLDAVKDEQSRAREAGRSARGSHVSGNRGRGAPPRGRGGPRGMAVRGRGRGRGT